MEEWLLKGTMPFLKESGRFLEEMRGEINAFLEALNDDLPEEVISRGPGELSYKSSPGKEYFSSPRGRRTPPVFLDDYDARRVGSAQDIYHFGKFEYDDEYED